MKRLDLTGKRFGRLVVLKLTAEINPKNLIWVCKCDCGKITEVTRQDLRKGDTRSCGCLDIDTLVLRVRTHGKTSHPLYEVWSGIKKRCFNKNSLSFNYYGKKGILMCKKWKNHFSTFYNWAIKNGYKKQLQIDRINNKNGYNPSNCRFVSSAINCENRNSSKWWIINDKKFSSAKRAARYFNVSRTTIKNWCLGTTQGIYNYLPHPGCKAERKYEVQNVNS